MGFSLGSNTINDVKLGSSQVNELYLGSTKFWPDAPAFNIFIGGLSLGQLTLETKLTGETITAFSSSITPPTTNAFTTTNYTISRSFDGFAFNSNITSFIDDGKCVGVEDLAFYSCFNLIKVVLPNVPTIGNAAFSEGRSIVSISQTSDTASVYIPLATTLGPNAFEKNINLVSIDLPNVVFCEDFAFSNNGNLASINMPSLVAPNGLGGNPGSTHVFQSIFNNGTATFPIAFATNDAGNPDGDIQYLIDRGWTINYV